VDNRRPRAADGRLVLGGEQGSATWLEWCARLVAAVERELAGELLGLPGLCPATLGVDGGEVDQVRHR